MSNHVAVVAFPTSIPGMFDYSIPDEFQSLVAPGSPVLVEVRTRKIWGMVITVKATSEFPKLKPVLQIQSGMQLQSFTSLVKLYEWIAGYYQCDLGKVFKQFVRKKIMETEVKQITLFRKGDAPPLTLTPRQASALDKIGNLGEGVARQTLMSTWDVSAHMIEALCSSGALVRIQKTVLREASEMSMEAPPDASPLSKEQSACVDVIAQYIGNPDKPFLLHGITGSGKTHVYIELARKVLALGRGVIILVPEISLTPQTIQRFRSVLGQPMTVMHSNMSDGERRDSFEQLISGKVRMVIGVRSAILAPVDELGLIIVDEEHDGSYKQADPEPRYHARDVAIMRGRLQKAVVVLGSATPAVESYYNAHSGKYHLLELHNRFGAATLPGVTIVDMNQEKIENNWTPLSRILRELMVETLAKGRQVILLLNRRGFSTFLICKDCGNTYRCPNCSVNLVYHRPDANLRCHQCGHIVDAPSTCIKCKGEHLQYKGAGIQKAEEHLRELFPGVAILRMDQDTTRRKGAHVSIIEDFSAHRAQILLGTQMVAKGLNFPGVALVGVLQADVGLHIPDFRAAERTFQLLTQVAGRAGRTDALGKVIIQTHFPTEPCIVSAAQHDYTAFVEREIRTRVELGYPPVSRLSRVVVEAKDAGHAEKTIEIISTLIRKSGGDALQLLGPAPAILERIKDAFRFSLLIKSTSPAALQKALAHVRSEQKTLIRQSKLIIDVDPQHMM